MEKAITNENEAGKSQNSIAIGALIFGFFTILSRVFGMVRDLMVSHIFGASLVTDAFWLAFTIPNTLRQFFGEGSFGVAFAPVHFTTLEKEGKPAAKKFFQDAFGFLFILLSVISLIGVVFPQIFTFLFAFGFRKNQEQFLLATSLTRYMFPYVLLISLVALFGAYLQCYRKFAAMSASPIILNLSMIIAMLLGSYFTHHIYYLAFGVIIGGILQVILMIISLKNNHLWQPPTFDFNTESMKHLRKLLLPGLFGIFVYQLNILVLRQIASFLGEGQLTYYYNADRLTQLAIGVFAVSISSASLPEININYNRFGERGLLDTLRFTMSMISFIITPCAFGLCFFAKPIISILFLHGAFTPEDAHITAKTLAAFSLSLIPFCFTRPLIQGFYAIGNTKIPVKIGVITLILNLILGLLLIKLEVPGLALTISLSSAAQFFLLWFSLKKQLGLNILFALKKTFIAHACLSFFSCLVIWPISLFGMWDQGPTISNLIILAICIILCSSSYFLLAYFFKLQELINIIEKIRVLIARKK